jgi:hypothetical protein
MMAAKELSGVPRDSLDLQKKADEGNKLSVEVPNKLCVDLNALTKNQIGMLAVQGLIPRQVAEERGWLVQRVEDLPPIDHTSPAMPAAMPPAPAAFEPPVVPGVIVDPDWAIDPTPDPVRPRPAPKPLNRRWYLAPNGDEAGIYYGTWDEPENIRKVVEGVPAPVGRPTSRSADSLEMVLAFNATLHPPADPIFRGPNASILPPENADIKLHQDLSLLMPVMDEQMDVEYDYDDITLPAPMLLRLHEELVTLYRFSFFEGYCTPPNPSATKSARPFYDRESGATLIAANQRGPSRVANYLRDRIGTGQYLTARMSHPPKGSSMLTGTLASIDTTLSEAVKFSREQLDGDPTEDRTFAAAAETIWHVFESAQAEARLKTRLSR